MSRLTLFPASWSAAMADAAVTPEVVPPDEKSRFDAVSFISSIFICRALRVYASIPVTWICLMRVSSIPPSTSTSGSFQSKNCFLLTLDVRLTQKRGFVASTDASMTAPESRSM